MLNCLLQFFFNLSEYLVLYNWELMLLVQILNISGCICCIVSFVKVEHNSRLKIVATVLNCSLFALKIIDAFL